MDFPNTQHVKDLGLSQANDEAIWNIAAEQNFTIVSKDTDFINRALISGSLQN